jgi:hypothetical protein
MEGSLVAYKVFTNGSVLNASEINDNLMNQSVMVFSNSTARAAALTTPLEGMLTWLEDVNRYESYNGTSWVQLSSGKVVQVVNVQTGAVATGTAVIPSDDTIPQQTEGTQFMSLAITPTDVNNILIVEVVAMLSPANNVDLSGALFQDATANAVATSIQGVLNGDMVIDNFRHYMVAGTTSATTFKYRSGGGAGATITFNGQSSARKHGGRLASSITITELRP